MRTAVDDGPDEAHNGQGNASVATTEGGRLPSWAGDAAVVVLVAVGVVPRFVQRSPLWLDEALSVNIASLPVGDLLEALRHDGHPPLYYLLLHVWMEVFGEGDVAVRALSGVISVATLPLAWVAGRRLAGPSGRAGRSSSSPCRRSRCATAPRPACTRWSCCWCWPATCC